MKNCRKAVERQRCRRALGAGGSAAVELAITLPMLMVLVLGMADYGILMNGSAALVGASRAGAEYATGAPTDTTGIQNQVTGFMNFSPALKTFDCNTGDSCVNLFCTCADGTWPTGTACPPTASGACAAVTNPYISGNPPDPRVLEYVTVIAAQTFSPLFTVKNFFTGPSPTTFGFPSSVAGKTVARAQ